MFNYNCPNRPQPNILDNVVIRNSSDDDTRTASATQRLSTEVEEGAKSLIPSSSEISPPANRNMRKSHA